MIKLSRAVSGRLAQRLPDEPNEGKRHHIDDLTEAANEWFYNQADASQKVDDFILAEYMKAFDISEEDVEH